MTISEFIAELEEARKQHGDVELFVQQGYNVQPVESLDLVETRVGYNEQYDEFFETHNVAFGAQEALVLG